MRSQRDKTVVKLVQREMRRRRRVKVRRQRAKADSESIWKYLTAQPGLTRAFLEEYERPLREAALGRETKWAVDIDALTRLAAGLDVCKAPTERKFSDVRTETPGQASVPDFLQDGPYATIRDEIAPAVLQRFLDKGRDYGDTFTTLGVKGQFADIHRKYGKLRRALWDDAVLEGEQPEEILQDFIGHCYLTLYLLNQQTKETK